MIREAKGPLKTRLTRAKNALADAHQRAKFGRATKPTIEKIDAALKAVGEAQDAVEQEP